MAELAPGRIILGNVEAADSVPDAGPEKKIENGVWFASGDASFEADPAAAVKELRIELRPPPPGTRTPAVGDTSVLAPANPIAAPAGVNCGNEFKIAGAKLCASELIAANRGSPAPACVATSPRTPASGAPTFSVFAWLVRRSAEASNTTAPGWPAFASVGAVGAGIVGPAV